MNLTTNILLLLLFIIIIFCINDKENFVVSKKVVPKKVVPKKVVPKKVVPKKVIPKPVPKKVIPKPVPKKVIAKPVVKVIAKPVLKVIAKPFNTTPVNTILQYTSSSNIPTIITPNSIAPLGSNIVPVGNEISNNYVSIAPSSSNAVVNKSEISPNNVISPNTEISITNDIIKPISNVVINALQNPPGLIPDNVSQPPKNVISITNDIFKPIVNIITAPDKLITTTSTNEIPLNSSSEPQLNNSSNEPQFNNSSNEPQLNNSSSEPQLNNSSNEPQPNISLDSENLFLLDAINFNGIDYYGTDPNIFSNIDFVPDNKKYLKLRKKSKNVFTYGLPVTFDINAFN